MRSRSTPSVRFAATEVSVQESATTVIQTDTPSIGSELARKQIIELPTNLRSVMKNSGDSGLISEIMPITVPGVEQVAFGASWITPGSQAVGVKVKVDGIETTFGNFGYVDNVSQPSVESVEEFTANVFTNRAEFGGVSSITSVTKSDGVFKSGRCPVGVGRNFASACGLDCCSFFVHRFGLPWEEAGAGRSESSRGV